MAPVLRLMKMGIHYQKKSAWIGSRKEKNMNSTEKITIIGAGHGGKAMAAHLALMGFQVSLYNRTFDHISIIKKRGGIELENAAGLSGFGKLKQVTSNMGDALKRAQVVMVVVPSSAHGDIAKVAA